MSLSHGRYTKRLASKCQEAISACVSRLRYGSGPNAVLGLVIPVVILSLYGVIFGGGFAHVFEKEFEFQPSVANRNTPIEISSRARTIWISGAGFHIRPASIGVSKSFPVGGESFYICFLGTFIAKAPTRGGSFSSQVEPKHLARPASAFARAFPHIVVFGCSPDVSRDTRASELFSSEINFRGAARIEVDRSGVISNRVFRLIHIQRMFGFSAGLLASTGDRRAYFLPKVYA